MNKSLIMAILVLAFSLGFVSSIFLSQKPGFISYNLLGRVIDNPNITLPNHLDNDKILVYDDKVIIKINNSKITNYESSSMYPFLGVNANGIAIAPVSPDEINIGDIITYRKNDKFIVHRVVEKGSDEQGVYFITKGDNSNIIDGKIRFEEIEHILVGILY